jgi:hypothetical protein
MQSALMGELCDLHHSCRCSFAGTTEAFVFPISSGRLIPLTQGHEDTTYGVHDSKDIEQLGVADASAPVARCFLQLHHPDSVLAVLTIPTPDCVITACQDHVVRIW